MNDKLIDQILKSLGEPEPDFGQDLWDHINDPNSRWIFPVGSEVYIFKDLKEGFHLERKITSIRKVTYTNEDISDIQPFRSVGLITFDLKKENLFLSFKIEEAIVKVEE